jgi:hypothetical protein
MYYSIIKESLLLEEEKRNLSALLTEEGVPLDHQQELIPILLEDEELLQEFLTALKGMVGGGMKKIGSALRSKGGQWKQAQLQKGAKMKHGEAVKAYGKAVRGKDEKGRNKAYADLLKARQTNRLMHGRAGTLSSQPTQAQITKSKGKKQNTALGYFKKQTAPGQKAQTFIDPEKRKATEERYKRVGMRFTHNEIEGEPMNETYVQIAHLLVEVSAMEKAGRRVGAARHGGSKLAGVAAKIGGAISPKFKKGVSEFGQHSNPQRSKALAKVNLGGLHGTLKNLMTGASPVTRR